VQFESNRFITRYNAIKSEVDAHHEKRRESVAIVDEGELEEGDEQQDEEEEPEDEEAIGDGEDEGDHEPLEEGRKEEEEDHVRVNEVKSESTSNSRVENRVREESQDKDEDENGEKANKRERAGPEGEFYNLTLAPHLLIISASNTAEYGDPQSGARPAGMESDHYSAGEFPSLRMLQFLSKTPIFANELTS
jgi:hypothetical protein